MMAPADLRNVRAEALTDYIESREDEPHRRRAALIRAAHPEVQDLMGVEPATKWVAVGVVVVNLGLAWLCHRLPWWQFLAASYVFAGTGQANLFLAIHEISHNLAFRELWMNRALSVVCNLPLIVPYAHAFKPYHLAHHKSQGSPQDTDLPTRLEARLTASVTGKLLWLTFQILVYAFRPVLVQPDLMPRDLQLAVNVVACLVFDALLMWAGGPRLVLFLLLGMMWAGSFHPTAGHFLSEHHVTHRGRPQPETFSYYGGLNVLAWNVGYHNEHHDFCNIPWTRLPRLRAMAPEFYRDLPQTESWPGATWTYLTSRMSGFNRVVRPGGSVGRPAR